MEEKGKDKGPLMILTSGKVVGKPNEQWKEVKGNRVKTVGKQDAVQAKTEKEIVLVDKGVAKQVQTSNKYTALEVEEGEKDGNNQLALVGDTIVTRSPGTNPKSTGKLNPAAAVFNQKFPGIEATKEVVDANPKGNGKSGDGIKETTAQ